MRPNLAILKTFLRDTCGAVTVEYVILAAAVTGMGIASTDVIRNGMGTLAGTVDGELRGTSTDEVVGLSYADSFDNGANGWSGAIASEMEGVGHVLGPIGGSGGQPSVSRTFDIDPNASKATFEFDLLAMDSLDKESGIIYIGGIEVGKVTGDHGTPTFTAAEGLPDGVIIRATTLDKDVQLGGSDRYNDSITGIQISVAQDKDAPLGQLTFGFGSTANQHTDDESFAIDNFRATGLRDPNKS
ncbi:Flp family type IVb pilin [Jannaschia rubra]|uniref:Flp pilus assembly protein, pilin Flp n=1 Tax=Jannaschia rubra TaxID=282197 RepID=A0A0M6XLR5_9RHOB|nr:hypothetical protein [Jannaschia rubra]CTQ32029.1 hypothetical protein JAN5088_00788 [Jannaschia rubra]SFG39426.1 hypothetical protein SAMN04488517_104206 [Jannaschia rubra]